MRGLDERDRELLALRYGADLKARQIAELLGERTNTIEVALHRALGRLRKLMEEEGPAPQERPDEERPVRVQRSPRVDPEPPL
jgi:DNA-directed RNA polymerase specialized sigma24 family protein